MINIQEVSSLLAAIRNCKSCKNTDWELKHISNLEKIMDRLPSGSGLDCGVQLDDISTPEKFVFHFSFHHMDESGGYDGWTEHTMVIKPSLQFGFVITITGENKNQINEYLYDLFYNTFCYGS